MARREDRYRDRYWWSQDGLRLHYRDYAGGSAEQPPILCMPGLTRNARDFAGLAEKLSPEWRVLAIEFRGRGESGYAKDPMSYVPATYAQDVDALLREQGIGRFVAVGTSLGGIVAMLLSGAERGRIAGALLNDIGPEIDPRGLRRIRGYVGRGANWPTWMHAARAVQEANADAHPGFAIEDWLLMAKRLYRLNAAGRVVLDYDLRIAEPFRTPGGEAGPDMWRALDGLADAPVLVVRGARSDVLERAVAERMVERLRRAEIAEVDQVGHTPLLTEAELDMPIERWLAQVAEPVGA